MSGTARPEETAPVAPAAGNSEPTITQGAMIHDLAQVPSSSHSLQRLLDHPDVLGPASEGESQESPLEVAAELLPDLSTSIPADPEICTAEIEEDNGTTFLIMRCKLVEHLASQSYDNLTDLFLFFSKTHMDLKARLRNLDVTNRTRIAELLKDLKESARMNEVLKNLNINLELRKWHDLHEIRLLHEAVETQMEENAQQRENLASLSETNLLTEWLNGSTQIFTNVSRNLQVIQRTIADESIRQGTGRAEDDRTENADLRSQLITIQLRLDEALEEEKEARDREQGAYLREQEACLRMQEACLREQEAYLREQEACLREQEACLREQKALEREQEALQKGARRRSEGDSDL